MLGKRKSVRSLNEDLLGIAWSTHLWCLVHHRPLNREVPKDYVPSLSAQRTVMARFVCPHSSASCHSRCCRLSEMLWGAVGSGPGHRQVGAWGILSCQTPLCGQPSQGQAVPSSQNTTSLRRKIKICIFREVRIL